MAWVGKLHWMGRPYTLWYTEWSIEPFANHLWHHTTPKVIIWSCLPKRRASGPTAPMGWRQVTAGYSFPSRIIKMPQKTEENGFRLPCYTISGQSLSWFEMNKKCFRFFLDSSVLFLQSLALGKHVSSFAAIARHLKLPNYTTPRTLWDSYSENGFLFSKKKAGRPRKLSIRAESLIVRKA